jgi:hypothetical protein
MKEMVLSFFLSYSCLLLCDRLRSWCKAWTWGMQRVVVGNKNEINMFVWL